MSQHVSSMSPPRRLSSIVTTADGVNTNGANGKGANIGANAMSGARSNGESTANATAGRAAAIFITTIDKDYRLATLPKGHYLLGNSD